MSEPLSVAFLGTTGALPAAGRDAPCFLVNREILVDTGWYAVDRLLGCGMDPLEIDTVLITHSHADHYLALPQIFLFMACGRRKRGGRPLRVAGPAGDVEAIVEQTRRFIRLAGDPALELPVEVAPMEPGGALDLGRLRVATCAARHRMKALACRIEDKEGRSVTFSGDTGPPPRSRIWPEEPACSCMTPWPARDLSRSGPTGTAPSPRRRVRRGPNGSPSCICLPKTPRPPWPPRGRSSSRAFSRWKDGA